MAHGSTTAVVIVTVGGDGEVVASKIFLVWNEVILWAASRVVGAWINARGRLDRIAPAQQHGVTPLARRWGLTKLVAKYRVYAVVFPYSLGYWRGGCRSQSGS